jgi:predicted RNA-binding protein YlxR (DUF448 family)
MPKKVPYRKCVATLESHPKSELLRVVKTPDMEVLIDTTGRLNGRGAYLKKSKQAVDLAIKKKALARALETEIPQEVFDQLYAMFNDE